ncbi:hypothetical protein BH11PLA2_BH11PLA2_34470 [soil metagenome]
MRVLLLAVLFCSLGCSAAAAPTAVITGPATAIAGELVRLDASDSVGATKYRWKLVKSPDFAGKKFWRSNQQFADFLEPATLAGTYVFELLVSNAAGVDSTLHTLVVTNGSPGPAPPSPTPTPAPVPDPLPSGQFNIAADVFKWAVAISSPNRAAVCAQFAAALTAIAKSDPSDFAVVATAVKSASTKAIAGEGVAWAAFNANYRARLSDLYFSGKLSSAPAIKALLEETAAGFLAASK